MSNIEISTAHNISITYPLSSLTQRLSAYVIDGTIVFVYFLITLTVVGGYESLFYIFIFPVVIFYHLIFEIFNRGQSIGKQIMKLRVVSIRGISPTVMDSIKRWLFRLVDLVFSLGSLGAIFITGTERNQRIGDLVAQTTVISLLSNKRIDLNSIKEVAYDPTAIKYPGITRYTDSDMLLLKQVLSRSTQDPHVENRKMMIKLFKKITTDLEIDKGSVEVKTFLRTVLQEYILLTR